MSALKFQPKIDKIVELLLYLAHVRPGADKYQAVKFFYLSDREHLIRYGRPITYDYYYALSYGPVASTTLDLLNADTPEKLKILGVSELPFATEKGKVRGSGKDNDTVFIREPHRRINREIFSKSDLKVFDEIIKEYYDASFDDLFKVTHNHYAYFNAWKTRRHGRRAEMFYEEMIDDHRKRDEMIEDLASVSRHMR
jgi:uncharacterized phage-associated protein